MYYSDCLVFSTGNCHWCIVIVVMWVTAVRCITPTVWGLAGDGQCRSCSELAHSDPVNLIFPPMVLLRFIACQILCVHKCRNVSVSRQRHMSSVVCFQGVARLWWSPTASDCACCTGTVPSPPLPPARQTPGL